MGYTLNDWLLGSAITMGIIILCVVVVFIWSFIDYRRMEKRREKDEGELNE